MIFTVGTGHRSIEELLGLLGEQGVRGLVDVRSYPKSHLPHFSRDALEAALTANGIAYSWLGDDLGGLRKGGYPAHMATERFSAGIERLENAARSRRTAICCAEIDPARCHRRHIADELLSRGWQVVHILGPGETREHVVEPRQENLPFG